MAPWDPDLAARLACRTLGAGPDQRLTEPAEVGALRGGTICEGRAGVVIQRARIGLATVPGDREVLTEPFDEATDEPVIARPERLGLGRERDASRVAGRDDKGRGGRMERDGQFGVTAFEDPPRRRPDGVAVLGQQPGLDTLEEALAGRHAQDQAPSRGLTDDPGQKWADDHQCHGSIDHTVTRP